MLNRALDLISGSSLADNSLPVLESADSVFAGDWVSQARCDTQLMHTWPPIHRTGKRPIDSHRCLNGSPVVDRSDLPVLLKVVGIVLFLVRVVILT